MYGKIVAAEVDKNVFTQNETLVIRTESDTFRISFSTQQQCCEDFMLDIPEEIKDIVGETLVDIRVAESAPQDSSVLHPDVYTGEDSLHGFVFILVLTNKFTYTLTAHNAHNGYYAHAWSITSDNRGVISEGSV